MIRSAIRVAILASVVCLAGLSVWLGSALRPADPDHQGTVLVHIPRGCSALDIGRTLEQKRLLRSGLAFAVYCLATGAARRLQAGWYDISASMSAREIAQMLCEGKVAKRRVVVVPGLTIRQVAARIAAAGLCSEAEFIKACRTKLHVGEVAFPLPPTATVEGYLFPATYHIPVGTPPEKIVRRMLVAFQERFWQPHKREIAENDLGLHGIVTLASMVEREAALDEERPIIAGVLMNRLRRGMPLQCDATVQYALGKHKPRLLYRDLRVNSPYNTYLHKGLPPGPICSPGLKSLLAALHPAKHDYLFYVAKGGGRHVFTRTYAEHRRAIARIRGKSLSDVR